jgi:acetamidase/formamidase
MFGCSEHWLNKRFSHAKTEFLLGPKMRGELAANDALDASSLALGYENWRGSRAFAASRGADPYALADGSSPAGSGSASAGGSSPLGGASGGGGAPPRGDDPYPWNTTTERVPLGRTWTIPSTAETVELGRFDPKRAPIVTIESGDVLRYVDTWTHFLGALQPGVPIAALAEMRKKNPGRGVHSIIGPIAVRGAKPGDLLEVRFLDLRTIDYGANFHNAGELRTGSLPDEFHDGHVQYFDLHGGEGYVQFAPHIKLEMRPFQGTFGVAAAGDAAISSVAPHQHAGNIDVKEMTAGTTLFIPVFHDGALIFTGDSHALQGDGEVNITAIETAMEEVLCQVILHPRAGYSWPMIETKTHWLMLGMDPNLNDALRIALRNTIDFLAAKAALNRDEAYSLASIGVDFRVSQMVDVNNGIHAMIPKSIFAPDFLPTMAIV